MRDDDKGRVEKNHNLCVRAALKPDPDERSSFVPFSNYNFYNVNDALGSSHILMAFRCSNFL
jgi:hypothetical protein